MSEKNEIITVSTKGVKKMFSGVCTKNATVYWVNSLVSIGLLDLFPSVIGRLAASALRQVIRRTQIPTHLPRYKK
jgi:hypothetical protein